jgi:hypothetical protein
VPDFQLSDYLADGGISALTIKGKSFQLPCLELPLIAGLNISQRLPVFNKFDFHHGNGDVVLAGGEENRVMTGAGDDLAFIAGKTQTVIMGDGDDAALMLGQKNNFHGGFGADLALVGGSENQLKGQEDNDLLMAFGLTNKLDGGKGDDALIAFGKNNSLDGGEGKDFMIAVGDENKLGYKPDILTGDGDDTMLAIGCTNSIRAGFGNDWVLAVGLKNTIDNEITQSKLNYMSSVATVQFQKKNMQLAENVYQQTKKKFEAGTGSNTEISAAHHRRAGPAQRADQAEKVTYYRTLGLQPIQQAHRQPCECHQKARSGPRRHPVARHEEMRADGDEKRRCI